METKVTIFQEKNKYRTLYYVTMKGISPVIATVLLLLMAVAAVGGAWVWYQGMQESAQSGGSEGIKNIQNTGSLLTTFINRAYLSGENLVVSIGNLGSSTVQISDLMVKLSGGSYAVCNDTITSTTTANIGVTEFVTINCTADTMNGTYYTYVSGTTLDIMIFGAGTSIDRSATLE